jgi:hypothetical protein
MASSTLRTSSWLAGLGAALLLGGAACSSSSTPPAAFGITIPAGTSKVGTILLNPGTIAAQFAASFSTDGQPKVTTVSDGPGTCTILQQSDTSTSALADRIQAVSAGTVTVTGPASQGMPVVLTPVTVGLADGGASVQYESDAGAPTFGPDVPLTIAATGAEVPAFSFALATPDALTFAEPSLPDGTPLVVSRSQDLRLAWSPTTGTASIGLEIVQSVDGTTTTVGCSFPQGSGSAVIPASVLDNLAASGPADAGAPSATMVAVVTTFSQLTVNDWFLVAEATGSPVLHAGSSLILE